MTGSGGWGFDRDVSVIVAFIFRAPGIDGILAKYPYDVFNALHLSRVGRVVQLV
jgi:hypothetical protein